jgi:hypothetical protein
MRLDALMIAGRKEILIVIICLPIGVGFTLRSNTHRAVKVLGVREGCVFVFITAGPSTKLFTWGMCVFITAGPSTKLWGGGGDMGGHMCVCLLLQDLVQSCLHGGGGYGRTCATRDDEPRPVWTRLPITH